MKFIISAKDTRNPDHPQYIFQSEPMEKEELMECLPVLLKPSMFGAKGITINISADWR